MGLFANKIENYREYLNRSKHHNQQNLFLSFTNKMKVIHHYSILFCGFFNLIVQFLFMFYFIYQNKTKCLKQKDLSPPGLGREKTRKSKNL